MQPPIPQRRPGSLGCLGVFSIFCLLLFSGLEVALLFHLNPTWFDKHAAWRGERYEAEVFLANDPQTRQRLAQENLADFPPPVVRQPPVKTVRRLVFATTQADYDPGRGGTLTATEGTKIEMPAGSISEPCKVSITPLIELPDNMQVQFAGPIYDLRVGRNEHYTFRQPLRVTMPYVPEKTDRQPRLAVYEGNGWRELPSQVDAQGGTVTADLPHASFIGVVWDVTKGAWNATGGLVFDPIKRVWVGLSPGAQRILGLPASIELVSRIGLSGTVRGWFFSAKWIGCETHDTANFAIHYTRTGEDAIALNPEYDKSPDVPGEVPKYVQRVAQLLEEARADLESKGWPLPTRRAGFRYDVFLCKSDSYGESPLNGPMFLNAKLTIKAATDQVDADRMFRHTVVHEMIHVAQGEYYGIRKSMAEGGASAVPTMGAFVNRQGWWVELTAAYASDAYWRQKGNVTEIIPDKYSKGQGKLLCTPMDMSADPDHYGYGAFLLWLDRKYSDGGNKLMWDVFKAGGITTGEATPAGIDTVCQTTLKKPLGDLFTEFAKDYYVDDFADGDLARSYHRGTQPHRAMGEQFGLQAQIGDYTSFILVSQAAGQNQGVPTYATNDYAMASTNLFPHLSAYAAHMLVGSLPKERKAKLVIRVQQAPAPAGAQYGVGPKDIVYHLAQGKIDPKAKLPIAGWEAEWSTMPQGVDKCAVIELWKTKTNFAAVVGVNKSPTGMAPGFMVDRWLLMPPQQIQFAREQGKQWKVRWKHEELHLHPPAFANYIVYRKKAGEADSAYVPVVRVQDDFALTAAPDDGSYVFTVATEDKVGNVSEKGRAENSDPFEGVWAGEIALVQGEFVGMMDKEFEKGTAKRDKEKQAEFARIQDPNERSRRAQDYDKSKQETKVLWTKIRDLLKGVEDLARIGMPMELEIKRSPTNDREYEVRLKSFLYQPMNPSKQDEPLTVVRVGERTLAVKQDPEPGTQPLPPVLLTLVRMKPDSSSNTIREDNYRIPPDPTGVFKGATLKWEFVLKEEKAPADD